MAGQSAPAPPLTSQWPGLSPHLQAEFWEVRRTESGQWERADLKVSVSAPLTDCAIEATLNWQSQFENTGIESSKPMLMSMLQSGGFQSAIDVAKSFGAALGGDLGQASAELVARSEAFLKQFEGRTGITKLNSTQVFVGMQPVKVSATALFRAWADPVGEVEKPVDQLWQWALPQMLATESTLLSRTGQAAIGEQKMIDVLMPSKMPVYVAMRYKGKTYFPLVIESINFPAGGPTTKLGKLSEATIQLALGSLTAWGKDDWIATSAQQR